MDPLFTSGNDTVDINGVVAGSYIDGTQYVAGNGNDLITLPDIGNAGAAGFVIGTAFDGGAGADTITGGNGSDLIFGGAGNDSLNGAGGDDMIDATRSTVDQESTGHLTPAFQVEASWPPSAGPSPPRVFRTHW